jgi:hypothetical protein
VLFAAEPVFDIGVDWAGDNKMINSCHQIAFKVSEII